MIEITAAPDGNVEIHDQALIDELIANGFRLDVVETPERLAEILENVPEKFRQDFLDGVDARPR